MGVHYHNVVFRNKSSLYIIIMDLNINLSESQVGGNPALKDLAVPAGLFFLQQAFAKKTPQHKESEDGEMMPISLYDRLLELSDETPSKVKRGKKSKKQVSEPKRKTKKNRK